MTKTNQKFEDMARALGLRLVRHPRTKYGTEKIDIFHTGARVAQAGFAWNNCGLHAWLNGYAAAKSV